MGYFSGKNVMLFGGALASSANCAYKASRDVIDVTEFEDGAHRYVSGKVSAKLSMMLAFASLAPCRYFQQMFEREAEFVLLGTGRVCPYCGDYNPAGTLTCWRCGGLAEDKPFVKPRNFPFMAISFSIECALGDLVVVSMDFVSNGAVDADLVTELFAGAGKLVAMEAGAGFPSGYYLCASYGQAVEDGKPCPFCGGVRLPLHELVKVDRDCVYCGEHIGEGGGIVCRGCAATISGQALKEALI